MERGEEEIQKNNVYRLNIVHEMRVKSNFSIAHKGTSLSQSNLVLGT